MVAGGGSGSSNMPIDVLAACLGIQPWAVGRQGQPLIVLAWVPWNASEQPRQAQPLNMPAGSLGKLENGHG